MVPVRRGAILDDAYAVGRDGRQRRPALRALQHPDARRGAAQSRHQAAPQKGHQAASIRRGKASRKRYRSSRDRDSDMGRLNARLKTRPKCLGEVGHGC